MTIEHKDIVDGQRHEPKGASTALTGTVYVADGLGSGVWKKVGFDNTTGTTAYGQMVVTNNSTPITLTAVADTTFNTPSQFTLFSGTGAPLAAETLSGITFNTNRLTVPYTGVYEINTYANVVQFPSNTAKISFRFLINGVTYSSRGPIVKSAVNGDSDLLSAHGLLTLNAGDFIQTVIASDTSGSVTIRDFNTMICLIDRTA